MAVLIQRNTSSRHVATTKLRTAAEQMLRSLGLLEFELSVLLCDDALIQKLNRKHRKKNKPTDVLAFPLLSAPPDPKRPTALGDVVISVETARKQALAAGHSALAEAVFLLAHGILHLVGYDHQTDAEEARMDAKTAKLVAIAEQERRRSSTKSDSSRSKQRATAKNPGRSRPRVRVPQ